MLRETLKKIFNEDTRIAETLFYSNMSEKFNVMLKEFGVKYKLVENVGGEGQGEVYYSVWRFSNDKEVIFVTFDGWYASYEGATFNEWYFSVPTQKMITVYEREVS